MHITVNLPWLPLGGHALAFEKRRLHMFLWMKTKRSRQIVLSLISVLLSVAALLVSLPQSTHAASSAAQAGPHATFTAAKAFDVSRPLRELARPVSAHATPRTLPPERGPLPTDHGFAGDGALQATHKPQASPLISA